MKLLVLLHPKFNDIELIVTLGALKKASIFSEIEFYNHKYTSARGQYGLCEYYVNNKTDIDKYDAIFIPGGKSAQELREDRKSLDVIEYFVKMERYVFAICDTPNALYEKGIFKDDVKYSSYPIQNIRQTASKNRNENLSTVYNGRIVTGRSAGAAVEFALSIIETLKGKEFAKAAKEQIFGL
ncbi:4-methyl-5(b-hydroxyethyl)-thiazole monophosphate biosynthesis [Metamycoplasma subdolum]|uniref:4-methyl-5(B-hydroxyethyl)-thiazole monophosphate biosynthesis n=1 Tax=Metamycoplasma subdolum TaxID=92407 RepID=A0A3M0A9C2_9BACT|nr:DJ-1/PfpI family protein [Metamycoplasma subdolum]RMA79005.1 4-methyl-5(b-hydroxyethyl)-thiazole monophosphate biosynthesis [Metamycoplasma subdolum]WPB50528.1 DJ-1/PfpI family protein [Metamycoplasma subdolum]